MRHSWAVEFVKNPKLWIAVLLGWAWVFWLLIIVIFYPQLKYFIQGDHILWEVTRGLVFDSRWAKEIQMGWVGWIALGVGLEFQIIRHYKRALKDETSDEKQS